MDRIVRILHLEDDAADAALVRATLESAGITGEIKWVQTREEFCTALSKGRYDTILADYRLPMFDGMSALQLVRECDPDVPFVFVSGAMGEDAAIAALTRGALDYVLKQKLSRLAPAVQRALREAENQQTRRQVENIMQARLRLLEFAPSHSLDEFLAATLDEIEALTGSAIGFFHFLEADQQTLTLINWSTNTLKNICTASGKGCHYDIAQAGVWVDCVHERRPVIHNDYASLPHHKGTPAGHAPVVRELVVPIFRGNLIMAIIGIGNKSADYNERDIAIVSQLGDLSWDIAEHKRAAEDLRRHARELEDANTALRVFMNRRDEDQKTLEEKLQLNINALVVPYLEKLSQAHLDSRYKNYLSILAGNLNNIVSPFMLNLSAAYKNLTPQEIQIANLIRQGKDTKEIAELLCTSVHTIGTHRSNIRKKLKLRNAKANLRSYLLSLP